MLYFSLITPAKALCTSFVVLVSWQINDDDDDDDDDDDGDDDDDDDDDAHGNYNYSTGRPRIFVRIFTNFFLISENSLKLANFLA